jgi:segregation and condensation protein B
VDENERDEETASGGEVEHPTGSPERAPEAAVEDARADEAPAETLTGDGSPEPGENSEPAAEAPAETGASPDAAEEDDDSVLPPAEMRAIVEALVFAAPQPITPREIGRVLQGVPKEDWQRALEELRADYARDERGLQLIEVAGGWQITTRPEYNDWVRELLDPKTPTRLSIQALETLSVIAYRQPVTLPEIIELRGVRSQGVVKTLLEKRLIRITGRKEVVGRPMLYGTTKQFLLHFGLKDLEELPQIEEFAEVLGEEVDIPGLKRAIEAPTATEVPLSEADEAEQGTLFDEGAGDGSSDPPESGAGEAEPEEDGEGTAEGDEDAMPERLRDPGTDDDPTPRQ